MSIRANIAEGLVVARIRLSELASGQQTINVEFTEPEKSVFLSNAIQNPGNEVFWAGHGSDGRMQIFSLKESGLYGSTQINLPRNWTRGPVDETTRTPVNWLEYAGAFFPRTAIIGGTRRVRPGTSDELLFAWMAAAGGGFPHAHIQVVRLDASILSDCLEPPVKVLCNEAVLDQFPIWNNDVAFAYPALIANSNNEVAVSLMVGGPSLFPTHAVGVIGDFQVFLTSDSDVAFPRNGDYVTVRQHFPNSKLFSAAGHGVRLLDPTQPSCRITASTPGGPPEGGCRFDPHYVLFGRASDIPVSGIDLVPVLASQNSCEIRLAVENRGDTDARATTVLVTLIIEPPVEPGFGFQIPTPPIASGGVVGVALIGPNDLPGGCLDGSHSCDYTLTVNAAPFEEPRESEFNRRNNTTGGHLACEPIP